MTLNTQFGLWLLLFVILILIAFALALTFSTHWCEDEEIEERKKTPRSNQPTQQENDYCTSPSSPHDESDAEHRYRQKTYRFSKARLINVAAGLNVLTAVAAGAGFGALYILYRTLVVTRIQAVTARQVFELSERPWMGVISDQIVMNADFSNGGVDVKLSKLPMKNFGKSVALDTIVSMGIADNPKDLDRAAVLVCTPGDFKGIISGKWGNAIFPDQNFYGADGGMPTVLGLFGNPNQVWIVGCIKYVDQFGTFYWTRFCYVFRQKGPSIGVGKFVPFVRYNDAGTQKNDRFQQIYD